MVEADQVDPARLMELPALQGLTSHSKCPLNPHNFSSTCTRTYLYAPRDARIHGFGHGFSHGSTAILLDAIHCDPTWTTAVTSRNRTIEWTIDSNTRLLLAIRSYTINKNNVTTIMTMTVMTRMMTTIITTMIIMTTITMMMVMMMMIMMMMMMMTTNMMMMVVLTEVRNTVTKTTTTTTMIRIKCFFIRYFLQENGGEIKLFLCIFT
ncbi:hypothetical protein WN51_00542 [Melipona quadrifasciata]|uniref:Uncharacterized protein n=1 Tax=Melipona quadrifasciata TaxID=166423 RepID=A0A0M9A0C9_9HYME|nr:hypothetical protein WN51_00542 [Melipona quadrifasciata]